MLCIYGVMFVLCLVYYFVILNLGDFYYIPKRDKEEQKRLEDIKKISTVIFCVSFCIMCILFVAFTLVE